MMKKEKENQKHHQHQQMIMMISGWILLVVVEHSIQFYINKSSSGGRHLRKGIVHGTIRESRNGLRKSLYG